MKKECVLICWSGGKDSSLALQAALQDPALEVGALLTTVTEGYERISMHGVRRELLLQQARATGLPLEEVRIPVGCVNAAYEEAMRAVLTRYQARGVSRVIFGDLFLREIREYREKNLARIGMSGIWPLWLKDTKQLAHDFIGVGFRAILVCVDPKQIDPSFCGREFDEALLKDLPSSADPCGENGEFHTFVYDGPIFQKPIPVRRGEILERDGFWFCDLLSERAAERI
ncbi:MAG: diphthine--ammonia ligase [Elusimicrobia bacterium]|nr:diphthine--ammonia ligase [Elusimicrobiota bacterium]